MPEVLAHQPLDAQPRRLARIPQALGRDFLQLVAEHVVVALRFEMQYRPDAQEELLGVVERSEIAAGAAEERRVGELGNRLGAKQVAQAARRLFDIRFELVEGLVEARVTVGNQRLQRLERPRRRNRSRRGVEERIEQRGVAGNRPRIGERELEFRVVSIEARALGHLAHVMPDRQADVPERVEEGVQEPLVLGPERAGEEDQHVDVGVETELAPAVAPEREDADRLDRAGRGLDEQLLDDRVHPLRVLLQRDAPALAPLGRGAQFGAGRLETGGTGRPHVGRRRLRRGILLVHLRGLRAILQDNGPHGAGRQYGTASSVPQFHRTRGFPIGPPLGGVGKSGRGPEHRDGLRTAPT